MKKRFPCHIKVQHSLLIRSITIYPLLCRRIPVLKKKTERDLIDSEWMQRLRRIHQLQNAMWVYPSAEHTRFQHSLGTMHMAGKFARHLYSSLKKECPNVPSLCFIEELFRVAGLLHDIGHGPYGHFFDDNFLHKYKLTHESLGKEIIVKKMGKTIKELRRSPSGPFLKRREYRS